MAKRKRRTLSSRGGRKAVVGGSTPVSLGTEGRMRFEHLMRQAEAFRLQQDLRRAKRCYEGVLKLLPGFVPAIGMLSQCYARLRDIEKGVELAKRAVGLDSFNAHNHANLADIYLMGGMVEEARKAAERAVEIDEGQVLARIVLAKIADQERDYGESIGHLTTALKEGPGDPNIIISLAQAYRFNKQADEASRMLEPLLERDDLPPAIRIGALNEMGMIYDQLKRTDEAYGAFSEYGRLTAESIPTGEWSKETHLNIINGYGKYLREQPEGMKRFDEIGERLRKSDQEAGRPCVAFLVGFPRSGTTMMEQIFDAHGDIVGVEEPAYLHDTKKKWREESGAGDDVDAMFEGLDEKKILELRRYFWERVDDDLGEGALESSKVLFYKHPLLISELPFINAIFPDSKVIVALRDPRDCCLSCFMQDFGVNAGMIHFLNLEDTCHFYDAVFGMYIEARERLTFDRVEIRYEDTVRDLEAQARRLIEFLELEWDSAVLRFHERAREKFIPTPSFAAVNEPVNTRAIARWKRYEKYFEGYVDLLSRYVEEFGYGGE